MWIAGHGRNPEPSLVIKGHLHGVSQIWKTPFIGKELYLISLSNLNLGLGNLAGIIVNITILASRPIVALHCR